MKGATRLKLFLLDNLIWVILAAFFLYNALFTDSFLKPENLVNIFYHSSVLSMLVLGQGIILLTGHIDLSIESTLAFAPAVAMLLSMKWIPGGLNPYLAILATLGVGALIGLMNGALVSRVGINSFILTLSMLIILRGLTLFLVPYSLSRLGPVYGFLGAARIGGEIPVAVALMLAAFLLVSVVLRSTPIGRHLLATGGNPTAAYVAGVPTRRMILLAFLMSGILAALAGLLAAGRQDAVNNSMGKDMVMFTFAGAILGGCSLDGGKGTALGMLGGALLLGTISNALTLMGINVFILYAVYGFLIFTAVLLDRLRVRLRERIFFRENLRRLEAAGGQGRAQPL